MKYSKKEMTTVEMSTAEETTCSLIEQMNVEMEVEVKIESDWTDYEVKICFIVVFY